MIVASYGQIAPETGHDHAMDRLGGPQGAAGWAYLAGGTVEVGAPWGPGLGGVDETSEVAAACGVGGVGVASMPASRR